MPHFMHDNDHSKSPIAAAIDSLTSESPHQIVAVAMCSRDFAEVRKWGREILRPITDPDLLKTGYAAVYTGGKYGDIDLYIHNGALKDTLYFYSDVQGFQGDSEELPLPVVSLTLNVLKAFLNRFPENTFPVNM